MRFSVVIPAYNRAAYLPATLASVWNQSHTDFEVIVVDDGSTDDTAKYLASLGSRVRVVSKPRGGPGSARNAGTAAARGEYVAFLDSDDIWMPWVLEVFADVIAAETPAIVVASVVQFTDEHEINAPARGPLLTEQFPDLLSSAGKTIVMGSGMIAVRRELLTSSGGFTAEVSSGEDLDLLLRIGDRPGFVRVTSPVMLAWRRHAHGATANLDDAIAGSRFLIAQEWAGRYPGGPGRAAHRREIITRQTRPVSLACLRQGRLQTGAELYRCAWRWHVALRRWRYLAAFPAMALVALLRQPFRRPA